MHQNVNNWSKIKNLQSTWNAKMVPTRVSTKKKMDKTPCNKDEMKSSYQHTNFLKNLMSFTIDYISDLCKIS